MILFGGDRLPGVPSDDYVVPVESTASIRANVRELCPRLHGFTGEGAQTLGEDMVVTLNVWRDASPAVALSYVQSAALPRDVLFAILHTHAYPRTLHPNHSSTSERSN